MTAWTDLLDVDFAVRFVDSGGTRTRALQAGAGEDVIFLHGTSGHLEAFTRNIAAHAAHFRCHAIDMLGHGFTDGTDGDYEIPGYVDHLVRYMDAAEVERAHLVGESLGGWVAAWLASERPGRVGRLSLVTAGGTVANPAVMERIKTSTRAAVEQDDIALTRQRLDLLMFDPATNVTDELVDVRHTIYHRPAFRQHVDHLLCLQEMDVRQRNLLSPERMGQIEAETLIVWSRENPFGQLPEAELMRDAIPSARLEVFDECGHWPQYEHAERFNDLNIGFLRGG